MKRVAAVFCAGILSSIPCHALELKGLLGLGVEYGGDSILTLTFSDGSTQDVLAGQGLLVYGGVEAQDLVGLGPVEIDAQATFGVKYSTIQENANADANFYRFPIEVLAFARWRGLRIGAGPVFHVANSFSGSGALAGYDISFDNALGVTAQVEYVWFKHYGLGARYTSIPYQPQLSGSSKVSGSNFGAGFTYYF